MNPFLSSLIPICAQLNNLSEDLVRDSHKKALADGLKENDFHPDTQELAAMLSTCKEWCSLSLLVAREAIDEVTEKSRFLKKTPIFFIF